MWRHLHVRWRHAARHRVPGAALLRATHALAAERHWQLSLPAVAGASSRAVHGLHGIACFIHGGAP